MRISVAVPPSTSTKQRAENNERGSFVIKRILPRFVAATATREELLHIELFPEEEGHIVSAVATRRREFMTGRACARMALRELGIAPMAIGRGKRGEPLWPAGVVGSITHCANYCACAVAKTTEVISLGIDAEVNAPLPPRVLERVAFGRERDRVAVVDEIHLDRLLFSAKEAIYKAWFPLTERWLSFEDVDLSIDELGNTFCARLLVPGPMIGNLRLTELQGGWCVEHDLICTAVIIRAGDEEGRRSRAGITC
jgi:4'-phosphopantetheinyl transferase EntD